jgi:hypothetical protein
MRQCVPPEGWCLMSVYKMLLSTQNYHNIQVTKLVNCEVSRFVYCIIKCNHHLAYCATALWLDNCVLLVTACRQGHKQLWGWVGGNSAAQRVSCDESPSKQTISYVAEKYTSGIAKILTVPRLGAILMAKDNFLLHLYSTKIVADYSFLMKQKSLRKSKASLNWNPLFTTPTTRSYHEPDIFPY